MPVVPAEAARPPAGGAPGTSFDGALLALIVAQVGLHACMAGVRLAAPLLALRLGLPPLAVGVLLGLFALAPIVLALRAGRMADRRGFHAPMRRATAMTVAGVVLAVVAALIVPPAAAAASADGEAAMAWLPGDVRVLAGFAVLCLSAVLSGAGANFGLIASQTTAGLRARDAVDRRRVFSWLGLAPSLSNAIGPVIAGVLIDIAGFAVAYAALLLLPAVSALAVRRVPAAAPRVATAATAEARRLPVWHMALAPGMRRLLLVNLLLSASWDLHAFLLPVLGHERGFSASAIGAILGVFAVTVALVRLVMPVLAAHAREHRVLVGAMLWAGLVFAAYPFAGSALAMGACAAGLGLALGVVQPMIMSALHHLAPEGRQGEAIALRSMTINVSSTVMPLVFGAAGTAVGASLLFWAMGAVLGAGSWPARRVGRER